MFNTFNMGVGKGSGQEGGCRQSGGSPHRLRRESQGHPVVAGGTATKGVVICSNIAVFVSGGGTNFRPSSAQRAGKFPRGGDHPVRLPPPRTLTPWSGPGKTALRPPSLRRRDYPLPRGAGRRPAGCAGGPRHRPYRLAGYLEHFERAGWCGLTTGRSSTFTPSLIPSFCGAGYYGLKVHEAALAYGVKVTGATVHFVNEIPDAGKIILQKAVEVREGHPGNPSAPGDGRGRMAAAASGGGDVLPGGRYRGVARPQAPGPGQDLHLGIGYMGRCAPLHPQGNEGPSCRPPCTLALPFMRIKGSKNLRGDPGPPICAPQWVRSEDSP